MNTAAPSLPDLSPVQRRLIAWRVGQGMPLAQAAAVEGIGAAEAAPLLRDRAFLELVADCRRLARGSREYRRKRLVEMARRLVEQAAAGGDLEAAQVLLHFDRSRKAGVAHRSPACPAGRPAPGALTPAGAASAESGRSAQCYDPRQVRAAPPALPAAATAGASTTPRRQPATRPTAGLRSLLPLIRPHGRAPFGFFPPAGTAPQHHPLQRHGPPAMPVA